MKPSLMIEILRILRERERLLKGLLVLVLAACTADAPALDARPADATIGCWRYSGDYDWLDDYCLLSRGPLVSRGWACAYAEPPAYLECSPIGAIVGMYCCLTESGR